MPSSPFCLSNLQSWVANEAMPHQGLKGLRKRGDPFGLHFRDDNHDIAIPGGAARFLADNTENFRATRVSKINGSHEIHRNIALNVSATNREDKNRIALAQPTYFKPSGENGIPALIVGARGQFRHVISGRIGFDAAELAEIVDRVAAISSAAADAQHEQPAATLAQGTDRGHERLDP